MRAQKVTVPPRPLPSYWKIVCNGALFSSAARMVQRFVLVLLAASNLYLMELLCDIKVKFACVVCGYKFSSIVAFSCHKVEI